MERYNLQKLRKTINSYKAILKDVKGKTALVVLNLDQKDAFYSLAPLSAALDELGADINVQMIQNSSPNLDVLKDIWTVYGEMVSGIKNPKTKALKEFISIADKKCKGKLKKLFMPPEFYFKAGKHSFDGAFSIPYGTSWMKEHRPDDLLETAKIIWDQLYDLKPEEKVSIGFELLRKEKDLGLPLIDYLDNFQISYAMMRAVQDHRIAMGSSSSRNSQLSDPERIADLKATILGCELSKDVDEPVFRKFKVLSKLLKIARLEIASAVFGIHGKGYGGKHIFGDAIGYPSPNKKTRWQTPGQMIYRFDYYPQTALDPREPLARIAFTETLPIDIYIKTCRIDWLEMQKRDWVIRNIGDKCEYIIVEGKKFGKYQTKLKVGLTGKNGRRFFRGSDVETRYLVKKAYFERTGIKAGNMANIPGGEGFVTPEYMEGQFIGDVVISLDQSYRLSAKDPMVLNTYGNSYKVIKGPKDILRKFEEKKKEAWKKLMSNEKAKALPKDIIDINKRNFGNIGEFAINTNPEAELCDYLIVNEKIANMIHIALGSGFDADRATYYHTDIVIDAPRQELDIYGVDKNGKKHWIHKKGKFVI